MVSTGAAATGCGYWQTLIVAYTVFEVTVAPHERVHLTSTFTGEIPPREAELAVHLTKLAGSVVSTVNPVGTAFATAGDVTGVLTNEQAAWGTKVALALLNLVWRAEKVRTAWVAGVVDGLRTTVSELAVTTGAWQRPKVLDVVVTEPPQLVLHFKLYPDPAVVGTYCPASTVVNVKTGTALVGLIVISVAGVGAVIAFWTTQPDKTIAEPAGAVLAVKNLAVIKS